MALISVGEDTWAIEHEGCEKLYREIMEQFTLRSQELKTSVEYARISSSIRFRMKQFSSEVFQLKDKIMEASLSRSITQQEAERRSRLVEVLKSKERQLQELFNERKHSALVGGRAARPFADMGVSGWRDDEDEENAIGGSDLPSSEYSINEIRQQQQAVVRVQDEGLDVLSKVISRQKELAKVIGNEVDVQNDIIDDLTENMENTDSRIRRETKQIGTIVQKDKTWMYWMIIILLFITIVVVGVV
ncbi:syntaxin-8 [Hetaerina americana]|uniref:syntaxin-8 n=1 Tax=Hetaerina americana TaxID=62018 RepID=UPI003A7F2B7A